MSNNQTDKRYPYGDALEIANVIVEQLKPHCERIEIAGSIRRKKDTVKDIEIVAIPKPYRTGLFETGLATVVNQWEKVKGELEYETTRYTQRILPEGIKLDLFFADERNWGYILAIRTGSAAFSHKLAKRWVQLGYRGDEGTLADDDERYEIPEEKDLFRMLRLDYVEPEDREYDD